MMSAGKYLDNRALAAVQTWAEAVRVKNPSAKIKVEIFAAEAGTVDGVNIVALPGVADNVYPPQRKSFSMMRYLAEHHLEEYDWFMRLDDDAYISWPILEKLLRRFVFIDLSTILKTFYFRLDPTDKLYIGSPGFGKDEGDYVEEEMTYCMGGPGIVMSRELLRNLSPHLPSCLKKLYTEHEDLELGRCIQVLYDLKTKNLAFLRSAFKSLVSKHTKQIVCSSKITVIINKLTKNESNISRNWQLAP
jgi:chondroitin sulfate synthase